MTRRLRLPLVALTVAGVVVAAPAVAHDAAYSSHVTLSSEDNIVYKGNVSSSLRGCEKNRKVKLYMGMIGSGTYTGAFDFTNDEGHYKINTAPTIVPDYYTRAVRKVIERNGHTHTCRGATSNQL
jgi:hypothetical protein